MRRRVLRLALVALAAALSHGESAAANESGAPSILLVTVDTLRADRLGVYGSPLPLTPNIDRLARGSQRFDVAYAAAPSTLPSIAALLTGHPPESFGLLDNLSVYPGTFPTLAQILSARGWRTGAVVSNWLLREHAGLSAGFAIYDATYPQLEAHRSLPERTARDTTDAALRVLDRLRSDADPDPEAGSPVLLWVHYQDPHGPYLPPGGRREPWLPHERAQGDGARRLPALDDDSGIGGIPRYQHVDGASEAAWYRAGYDGEVAFTDEEVGRLLDAWEAKVPSDRSIVVFTADHGEGLGEDDYWFAHGEHLTDALVRVPLLIRAPGLPAATRGDVVSLIDVLPTLLAATGSSGVTADGDVVRTGGADGSGGARGEGRELTVDPAAVPGATVDSRLPGRDLLAPGASGSRGRAYVSNVLGGTVERRAIVDGDVKYVVATGGDGEGARETVTAAGGGDSDTVAVAPERLAALRAALAAALAAARPAGGPRPRVPELSAEERANLRALGYLAD